MCVCREDVEVRFRGEGDDVEHAFDLDADRAKFLRAVARRVVRRRHRGALRDAGPLHHEPFDARWGEA